MKKILCSIAATLALAACGHNSGSSDGAPSEDSVASSSVTALIAFAEAQIARTDADLIEPRDLAGINPPVSDADEPAVI